VFPLVGLVLHLNFVYFGLILMRESGYKRVDHCELKQLRDLDRVWHRILQKFRSFEIFEPSCEVDEEEEEEGEG